jgi:hypothetical protein
MRRSEVGVNKTSESMMSTAWAQSSARMTDRPWLSTAAFPLPPFSRRREKMRVGWAATAAWTSAGVPSVLASSTT